jgi:ABC-type molybdenum transport system ATPase subunit/photorepair protein PhrA
VGGNLSHCGSATESVPIAKNMMYRSGASMTSEINIKLKSLRKTIDRWKIEHETACCRVKSEKQALRMAMQNAVDIKSAIVLAQGTAQAVQEEAHRKIADIVSYSLAAVFDIPYQFKISFEQKRGRTEAILTFERDSISADPMTASGGGVVDVAAFALRLSCLLLSRPPLRRLLVLDEPFKWLSREFRPRVRALLEKLASEMNVQMVIVTHDEELVIGKVIKL